MTNREALLSGINDIPVKDISVSKVLLDQDINPDGEYQPKDVDNRRGVDLALAALILVISLSNKSIKELDFQITQHDIDQLLILRYGILRKWNVEDEMEESATITDISDLW